MQIVYIGQPETERSAAWVSFLVEHGNEVRTENVADIGAIDFVGADLAIVDGKVYDEPQPPQELRDSDLPLPTVLVGGVGGKVSDAIGLKLGWQFGCLCLNHQAIIAEQSERHPIFSGPIALPVVTKETIATPDEFRMMANTKAVPDTLDVAVVYTPTAEETENDAYPGLVSTSAGFLDSPDCEHILGGINSKAHDYNAVARHGRFLQWGFHAEPIRFTDLGRALFLNALHYIASFRDAPVETLVMQQHPRKMLQNTLGLLDRPEFPDPQKYLDSVVGGAVSADIGLTAEAALEWYDAVSSYLRYDGVGSDGRYMLDEDLVSLGIANNDPKLLEALVDSLDQVDEQGDRARRLWTQYLRRETTDIDGEREWFTQHRGSLFFTDWGGYRWISRDDLPDFQVPRIGTADAGDAYLWLTADRDDDGRVDAHLHVALRPGDYIYAPGATDGVPTTLALASDHELSAAPAFPQAENHHLPGHVLIPIVAIGDSDIIELDVRLQVCNAQSCSMPMDVRVSATVGSTT